MEMLKNKVAIITGGADGMGKATVFRFREQGAQVVIADISPSGADVAKEAGAHFIQTDVSESAQVDAVVEQTLARFGRLDIMFNNAGTSRIVELIDETDADFEKLMRLNFAGVFYGIRAAGRVMRRAGYGNIINTASIAGVQPVVGQVIYSATKAAVISLTKGAAVELGPYGVRVNAICPGTVPTALAEKMGLTLEMRGKLDALQPIGRVGLPSEIADAALYLASDLSTFVTGHHLVVDGGGTAASNIKL